jgi:5-methylcytosine-specific restriction endonuclease McrA
MILARDPLCKIAFFCKGLAPSTEADHIVPLSAGGDWSMRNGQGACHRCHSHKTATETAHKPQHPLQITPIEGIR